MNDLHIFNNPEFGQIRTVQLNNETYFAGKDVADALGYKDTSDALKKMYAELVLIRKELQAIRSSKEFFSDDRITIDRAPYGRIRCEGPQQRYKGQ